MKCKLCNKETEVLIEYVDPYGKIIHGIEYKILICKECFGKKENIND